MEYLSAKISNHEGVLKTKVYHGPPLEPYSLPYVLQSKTIILQDDDILLYAALARAFVHCSNADEFQNERSYIELSFKINDTSTDAINKAVQNFLMEFNITSTSSEGIEENIYQNVRQRLRQKQSHRVNKYILQEREQRQRTALKILINLAKPC